MLRFIIALLAIAASAGLAAAQGISVTQSLDEDNIAFTDSAIFEIVLEWEGAQSAYFIITPLELNLTGLKVRSFSSSVGSSLRAGTEITTKRFEYVLEPIAGGMASIEPVDIGYVSWPDSIPGRLLTETEVMKISAPKPVEEPKATTWYAFPVLGAVLAVIAIIAFLVWRKGSKRPATKTKNWREDMLDQLADARKVAGADLKRFQTEVYKILVAFLLRQHNINATNLSRDALLEQLADSGMSVGTARELCDRLLKARKDKYSPSSGGPGETVRLESELREFIEKL